MNYRHNLHCGPSARLDLLAGYRFAYLEDELFLGEVPDGSNDDYLHNRIAVHNPFHGGQVGLAGEYRGERLVRRRRGEGGIRRRDPGSVRIRPLSKRGGSQQRRVLARSQRSPAMAAAASRCCRR